jgi:hypothetical protein
MGRLLGICVAAGLAVTVVAPADAGGGGAGPGGAGADGPGPGGGKVKVSSTAGGERVPCPPVRVRGPKRIDGGCVLEANGSYIELEVKTMVGALEFSSCTMYFTMHVDRAGSFVIEDAKIDGRNPCNDAFPCFTEESILPWRGEIRRSAGGKLQAHVDMCLDTCMGRFRGPFVAELRPTRKGWRLVADHAPVGMSGWEFDGHLDIATETLEIAGGL